MSVTTELESGVDDILSQTWNVRDGQVVPESEDVALAGGAVEIEVAILYADMADSTELVSDFDARTAARVMKSFLYCASRIVRANGGAIRSFDGDRVMGIFIGDSKNSSAGKTALQINSAVIDIIRPRVERKYPTLAANGFIVRHASGVDRSKVLAVRAGMRGSNDLIWIGRAAAVAAKLSSIRTGAYASYITQDVYSRLDAASKTSPNGQPMWEAIPGTKYGLAIYRSGWKWKP
jgi:adenylate cyclase